MESIAEIKKVFADADISEYSGLIEKYGDDERDGVKKIIASAQKKINALEKEKARSYKMFEFERKYADKGYICGIDEVGRGPLAGPVVAAAVILPKDCDILYLNDSKQLTPKKIPAMRPEIICISASLSTGSTSTQKGICTKTKRAVSANTQEQPSYFLFIRTIQTNNLSCRPILEESLSCRFLHPHGRKSAALTPRNNAHLW